MVNTADLKSAAAMLPGSSPGAGTITKDCKKMQRFSFIGPKPPENSDVWYRADDKRYANYDPWAEFEQPSGSHCKIEITRYIVIRTTPKCVFIQDWLGHEYKVLGKAIRQHAVPTIELAIKDLIERKKKHVKMSEYRLKEAKEHLNLSEICLEQYNKCGSVV